ncbi:MAG: hypothetical protein V2A79_12640 [Planctomycetota bacterium]
MKHGQRSFTWEAYEIKIAVAMDFESPEYTDTFSVSIFVNGTPVQTSHHFHHADSSAFGVQVEAATIEFRKSNVRKTPIYGA